MWQAYFVAYRVNYAHAITSQERQGAGFVDSVATDPRPPKRVGGWVAALHHRRGPFLVRGLWSRIRKPIMLGAVGFGA
jgi:hypothetical protein